MQSVIQLTCCSIEGIILDKTDGLPGPVIVKRFGKLEDLNGMAIYLASNESDYVTGQTFSVNGGAWVR